MKWSIPALAAVFLLPPLGKARADEIPAKYLPTINKGLEYLVSKQFKDGH